MPKSHQVQWAIAKKVKGYAQVKARAMPKSGGGEGVDPETRWCFDLDTKFWQITWPRFVIKKKLGIWVLFGVEYHVQSRPFVGCIYTKKVKIWVFGLTQVRLEIVICVNTIYGYHYRASTRLRYQRFENRTQGQIWSRDPDSPKFGVQITTVPFCSASSRFLMAWILNLSSSANCFRWDFVEFLGGPRTTFEAKHFAWGSYVPQLGALSQSSFKGSEIVTRSKSKTLITRSVHCKFNCIPVNFDSVLSWCARLCALPFAIFGLD